MIAGKKGGLIDKEEILNSPYLIAVIEDFLLDNISYKITSFTISTSGAGFLNEYKCNDGKLSSNAIAGIKSAKSEQKIYFEDIKAIGPDGQERTLPSMIFKLK